MLRSFDISKAWRICSRDWLEPPGYLAFGKLDWIPATVPGHVHNDLVAAGVIGDPFFGLQELGCQWVDEAVWIYETEFEYAAIEACPFRELHFEGLDTVCIVHLNGAEIGRHDNMFTPLRVEVGSFLRAGRNTLRVTFFPALVEALERRSRYFAQHGLRAGLVRFEERAFLRKAPYMFGWDWGPRLVSAGIWKPVRLWEFHGKIDGVQITQVHQSDGRVHVACTARVTGAGRAVHILRCSDGGSIVCDDASEIALSEPKLWWPKGLGDQYLYELVTYLLPADSVAAFAAGRPPESCLRELAFDVRTTRFGLRTVELLREADSYGESFRFVINGRPVFCLGANWIPDHSYPSQVTRARLAAQLARVTEMNMNMLRVWGGGVYESDDFYDLCDERGILVWQDFPFACSYSPDDPADIAMIEAEALFNVQRLQHHPSLVLWCGNNENRMMFEAKWDDADLHPERCIGEQIWELALPNLLARLDPARPYISTSPHSPAHSKAPANADAVGDQHNWDVWHGRGDWRHYVESRARFASEYGFASAPTGEVWERMCGPNWEQRSVDDLVARWHDKTKKGYNAFRSMVELHYARASNLEEWTYASQLNQRDALRTAIEHYRRSAFCAGSLIWQLNDCWPVQSWSVLDSAGAFKAAAYELKRLYAPLLVSVELVRDVVGVPRGARIWIALHNSRVARDVHVEVAVRSVRTGELRFSQACFSALSPGESKVLLELDVSLFDQRCDVVWVEYDGFVFHTLLCEPKELECPEPGFRAVRRGDELEIGADAPAVDVFVCSSEGARLGDNFLNFPSAGTQLVTIQGQCAAVDLRFINGKVTIPVTT